MIGKILKPKYIIIFILVLSAFLRIIRLDYPSTYVFDEVYHAFTAKEYIKGNEEAWEWWTTPPPGVAFEWTHPPLAKEIMALSMEVFHTTEPWAYRIPGVIFALISIYLIYLIGKKLFKSEKVGLVSAFLFSLDGLNFVQSRTAMNDIYFVAFALATLYFFLNKRFIITAIFLGLALATKWTGIYLFSLILGLYAWENYKDKETKIYFILLAILGALFIFTVKGASVMSLIGLTDIANTWQLNVEKYLIPFLLEWSTHAVLIFILLLYTIIFPKFRNLGYLLSIPLIIYLLTYIPFFQLGHTYEQFTHLQQQMWWYHTGLKAEHNYSSPWWSWPLNLYPVWYFVDYHKNGLVSNIFASGNPLLYLLGIMAIGLSLWQIIQRKFNSGIITVLTGYAVFWLPWALSPRIMFLYHYTPAIPFLSLILGYQLVNFSHKKDNKIILWIILSAIAVSFLLLYPWLTGIPLSRDLMLFFFNTNLTKNPFGGS